MIFNILRKVYLIKNFEEDFLRDLLIIKIFFKSISIE